MKGLKKFKVVMERTYTTEVTIEANSEEAAIAKFYRYYDRYQLELEQNDVDEDITAQAIDN